MNAITTIELLSMGVLLVMCLVTAFQLAKFTIYAQGLVQDKNHIGLKLLGYVLIIIGTVGMVWLFMLALDLLKLLLA
jgi:hypothetical protein